MGNTYVVIGGSFNPKSCLLDCLGLHFLSKLDDISGDVSFVAEDSWPGRRLGWIYENMVQKEYVPPGVRIAPIANFHYGRFLIRLGHFITVSLLGAMSIVLPALAALTPFRAIIPE